MTIQQQLQAIKIYTSTKADCKDLFNLLIRGNSLSSYSPIPFNQFITIVIAFYEKSIESFEILPIKMKIDYKPKHIDYTNLKEGNWLN